MIDVIETAAVRHWAEPVRLVGIGGSLRDQSRSRVALRAALAAATRAGAETTLADVRALDLPMYDPDRALGDYPATAAWLITEVRRADGLILCSPTYHGTVSGAVKNALDLLDLLGDEMLGGKIVGLIGLGGGAHNVLNALYHSARALNALVVPTIVAMQGSAVDLGAGTIDDPGASKRLTKMTSEVIDLATRLRPVNAVS